MGLIKAALGAASGVMGDQWKEYFYCDALPAEVLAVKGQKRTNGRAANRHGSENVISDGSVIAVADGQCVLIVEQGKVVDLCAEPGEYTYSTGTQPSLLSGGLILPLNICVGIIVACTMYTFYTLFLPGEEETE